MVKRKKTKKSRDSPTEKRMREKDGIYSAQQYIMKLTLEV